MNKENTWESVFKVYPDVEEIYVCDGQPFIRKVDAEKQALATKKTVQKIIRAKARVKTRLEEIADKTDLKSKEKGDSK